MELRFFCCRCSRRDVSPGLTTWWNPPFPRPMRIRFGIDEALNHAKCWGKRIGMVTNDPSRLAANSRTHSRVALKEAGCHLVRLFSPEHGISGRAADGTRIDDQLDPLTGLPVLSLYGSQFEPSVEILADLDALVFDLADIGCRFYTYIWTLFHVLRVCAEAQKPLIVLDRPNPLGGELSMAEGPLLNVQECGSFLGRYPLPIRHCLTIGELAGLFNTAFHPRAELLIIPCAGWLRGMQWPDLSLPFVPTSPAMPSFTSALLYPGLCLFEGTNLSVGRGTMIPFQVLGAPWLRCDSVLCRMAGRPQAGVEYEIASFVPTVAPWEGSRCNGIRVVVSDRRQVKPVALGLHLMAAVIHSHPDHFCWARYPTAVNPTGEDHFDLLIGRREVHAALAATPWALSKAIGEWTQIPEWGRHVTPFLIGQYQ